MTTSPTPRGTQLNIDLNLIISGALTTAFIFLGQQIYVNNERSIVLSEQLKAVTEKVQNLQQSTQNLEGRVHSLELAPSKR
jgi:hypothetical protein